MCRLQPRPPEAAYERLYPGLLYGLVQTQGLGYSVNPYLICWEDGSAGEGVGWRCAACGDEGEGVVMTHAHPVSAGHLRVLQDRTVLRATVANRIHPAYLELAMEWHDRWTSGPYVQGPYFPYQEATS